MRRIPVFFLMKRPFPPIFFSTQFGEYPLLPLRASFSVRRNYVRILMILIPLFIICSPLFGQDIPCSVLWIVPLSMHCGRRQYSLVWRLGSPLMISSPSVFPLDLLLSVREEDLYYWKADSFSITTPLTMDYISLSP